MNAPETGPKPTPAEIADMCLAAAEGNARQGAALLKDDPSAAPEDQAGLAALAADVAHVLTQVAISQAVSAVVFQLRTPPDVDAMAASFAVALVASGPWSDGDKVARQAYAFADALNAARAERTRRQAGRPELSL